MKSFGAAPVLKLPATELSDNLSEPLTKSVMTSKPAPAPPVDVALAALTPEVCAYVWYPTIDR